MAAMGILFFVGNANHLPNRQAIEWLCFKFAPELAKHSAARIVIVGAGADAFPSGVPGNVDLLGASTTEAVEELYQECGLFLAPIANSHGSKIKLLQCLSLGTPFLATRNALSGLRGLEAPLIDLDDAPAAARLAAALLADHGRRAALSENSQRVSCTSARGSAPGLEECPARLGVRGMLAIVRGRCRCAAALPARNAGSAHVRRGRRS